MGRYIVKIKDRYMEWSTVVDAPVTAGMTLEEFTEHYRHTYGEQGMRELPERMARVEAKGVSAHDEESAESLVSCNRAGPDESELTFDEVYTAYCLGERVRDWSPFNA